MSLPQDEINWLSSVWSIENPMFSDLGIETLFGFPLEYQSSTFKIKVFNWLPHVETIDFRYRFWKKINWLFANFVRFWDFENQSTLRRMISWNCLLPQPWSIEIHRRTVAGTSTLGVGKPVVHRKLESSPPQSIENPIRPPPSPSKIRSGRPPLHRFLKSEGVSPSNMLWHWLSIGLSNWGFFPGGEAITYCLMGC